MPARGAPPAVQRGRAVPADDRPRSAEEVQKAGAKILQK
jgi:hypothetical protein